MTQESSPISARAAAFAACVFFAPVAVTFAVAPGVWWADYPGILFHLALFLLVPSLPAPGWAKAAGYGWLVADVITGVLTLNSVPHEIADPVRLGGHIFAGLWIVTASLPGSWPVRVLGVITGVMLFGYTFVSPFLPIEVIAPASISMLLWLGVIAWQDGSERPAQGHLSAGPAQQRSATGGRPGSSSSRSA